MEKGNDGHHARIILLGHVPSMTLLIGVQFENYTTPQETSHVLYSNIKCTI